MNRKRQAFILRRTRRIHRTMGAALFLLFLVISLSGLLLGWKKNSDGFILPRSYRGTSADLIDWISLDTLQVIASNTLLDSVDSNLSTVLARIDARPDKGMVKFVFRDHYWEVQVDGATGNLLHIGLRRSDFIENVHDGSILDDLFHTKGGILKLTYTSVMSLSLLAFTITGFWLWYGPKVMRRVNFGMSKRVFRLPHKSNPKSDLIGLDDFYKQTASQLSKEVRKQYCENLIGRLEHDLKIAKDPNMIKHFKRHVRAAKRELELISSSGEL